jgi:methylmalonyl-CoA mutase N-terminal domain/subunit
VGVNRFQEESEVDLPEFAVDEELEAHRRAQLQTLRTSRDAGEVSEMKGILDRTARGNQNLLPVFIACVEKGLTLGEITDVLRDVWGEYRPDTYV